MIGRTLSHYEILGEISRGGMGVVYRARDLTLGREVAFKVLPEELVHDPVRRERLLQEARAASALEHPHIAVIHEVGDAGGVTFIAMELIRGEKLSETLSRGPLLQTRALDLAAETAEGLARAHEKGIVHRDLKPANIMVTEDGHVKIIDFGLAKLFEPVSGEAATATVHGPRTDEGMIVGTAAYMSPEQARGARVDHRSDIFSLGLTLFEMLTGRPAFQGQSQIDTLQAVLTQPVPPVSAMAGSSAEVTAELQRIIGKCTEKDPDDRYQGMKDIVVDLRAARRRLESSPSGSTVVAPAAGARRAGQARLLRAALMVALVAAVGAAAWFWWTGRQTTPSARPSGKPALAVLYFENNTGDASLDWMRTGLTDMMVTDLSQSTDFEVIGTDRLVQILEELKRTNDRAISADVVAEIARRASVDNVLLGSYVKAGDTIRISARLQEARTGRIVTAEKVEGSGPASVFSLVDELTRRFKSRMAALRGPAVGPLITRPGETPEAGLDRGLTEITTSSIEAYRYYAEGLQFHERGLPSQAEPLLARAIEIDPDFAMAYAKLAVVYNNLGLIVKRDEYAKHAVDRTDRLTTRERYYIEGFYYSLRPETMQRAIDAYTQGLALHPEHQASRHNLGLIYAELERYPESIEQYEELLRRGSSSPTASGNLSADYIATGNAARAVQVMESFVGRYPESASALQNLGEALVADHRFDEARAMFDKARSLDPLGFQPVMGRWVLAFLQLRWAEAEAAARELGAGASPFQRFLGPNLLGQVKAGQGRQKEALAEWDRAAAVAGIPGGQRAVARTRQLVSLLRAGNVPAALVQAERAASDARGYGREFEALQWLAITQAVGHRSAESEKTLALLESRARSLPSPLEVRRVHWARGEIALASGQLDVAVKELNAAYAAQSAYGPVIGPPSSHPDLIYATALANYRAGHDVEAARLFDRLQSGHDVVFSPETLGRSLYLRGKIYERRGDAARAREQFTRFVDLWGDGELDREWVAEARQKIGR